MNHTTSDGEIYGLTVRARKVPPRGKGNWGRIATHTSSNWLFGRVCDEGFSSACGFLPGLALEEFDERFWRYQ
ncbi:hypothetical protein ACP8HI_14580 [Paenibacillus sp. FA6]|uniref:hypothetical protein n=1 Tax=Paenibacillus sp. FA6 TaxID=3413029 RepID=UPI003F65BACF